MSDTKLRTNRCSPLTAVLVLMAGVAWPATAGAQQPADAENNDTIVYKIDPVLVTATRSPRQVSKTPAPVALLSEVTLREKTPNTVTDLFRGLPGVDVNGVGPNQTRPVIRGQRGQRILLLQDGLRLNNTRRQQDFGELPALVDVSAVERVEVVRGPASVLYGTDAIGGVLNIVTPSQVSEGIHGLASYRYGSEGQNKVTGRLSGSFGRFSFQGGASVRDAGTYTAPAGEFGNITLSSDARVNDSGVNDWSGDLRLGFQASEKHGVFGKLELYRADETGFGWVDPSAYSDDEGRIRISYPDQKFQKLTFGYNGVDLGTPIVDRLDFAGYWQSNDRQLNFDLFQPISFGPGFDGSIEVLQQNVTDIHTYGFRLEAKKAASDAVLFTYGVDFFRDRTVNTDASESIFTSPFGPPDIETSSRPQVPNATYRSLGGFLQGEFQTGPLTVVAGGRLQRIDAETRRTPGLDDIQPQKKDDFVAVGSANAIVALTDQLSVVGTVGRAFRSPNIVEWFFEGPTPEGSGYQVRNPDLQPETSFNTDLGLRFVNEIVFLEGFYFRNKIYDGIRIAPTGDTIQGFPAFNNVNVDELMFEGVELAGDVYLPEGVSLGGSYTWLDTKDVLNPDNPIGESFSSKVTGRVRYQHPGNRFWTEYSVRHNGERKDVELDENPIGDVLPSFTVHDVRGGVTVVRTDAGQEGRLTVALTNLTNQLYAEFSNAAFFRPEPKRGLTLAWEWSF